MSARCVAEKVVRSVRTGEAKHVELMEGPGHCAHRPTARKQQKGPPRSVCSTRIVPRASYWDAMPRPFIDTTSVGSTGRGLNARNKAVRMLARGLCADVPVTGVGRSDMQRAARKAHVNPQDSARLTTVAKGARLQVALRMPSMSKSTARSTVPVAAMKGALQHQGPGTSCVEVMVEGSSAKPSAVLNKPRVQPTIALRMAEGTSVWCALTFPCASRVARATHVDPGRL